MTFPNAVGWCQAKGKIIIIANGKKAIAHEIYYTILGFATPLIIN